MAQRLAVLDGDSVVNVILVGDEDLGFDPGDGLTTVSLEDAEEPVCAGWTYVGGTWVEPDPPPPTELEALRDGLQAQIDELILIVLGGL